jgi:hypothetical protein
LARPRRFRLRQRQRWRRRSRLTVDAQGRPTTTTDRVGNAHALTRNARCQFIRDQVTTLGTSVDGAIRTIDNAHDTLGNLERSRAE